MWWSVCIDDVFSPNEPQLSCSVLLGVSSVFAFSSYGSRSASLECFVSWVYSYTLLHIFVGDRVTRLLPPSSPSVRLMMTECACVSVCVCIMVTLRFKCFCGFWFQQKCHSVDFY